MKIETLNKAKGLVIQIESMTRLIQAVHEGNGKENFYDMRTLLSRPNMLRAAKLELEILEKELEDL